MRFVAPPGLKVDEGRPLTTVGRYEIIKTLGKGAMGVVYKARDPLLDRIVAIKTIMSPVGSGKRVQAAYLERFQREAKAAAKMQHPSIVTIFDVGVDNGAPFMVLEYLPGETLADRLDRVRLPLGKGVQIGLDLANALAFAHRQRIVHRDVKPANVLHAGENRWKLADFGIARLPDSDLTQVGIFMGTPGYSPPEAIRHGRYTPQSDVFAWGAVLYELLSGRIPYEGPDTRTTNGYVLKGTAPSPGEHDRSIPQPLARVIMTALDPSAATRYKDGAEVESALRDAWEYCLKNNIIPTSCLTGEEVPHERVGPEMHKGVVHEPAPAVARPSPRAIPGLVGAPQSSELMADDDAPTQVLIRDSLAPPSGPVPSASPAPPLSPDRDSARMHAIGAMSRPFSAHQPDGLGVEHASGSAQSGGASASSDVEPASALAPAASVLSVRESTRARQPSQVVPHELDANPLDIALTSTRASSGTPWWIWMMALAAAVALGAAVAFVLMRVVG